MVLWYIWIPNSSNTFTVRIDSKKEADAKQWVRQWLNTNRLPNGTKVWRG